jgi:hypothetical protein
VESINNDELILERRVPAKRTRARQQVEIVKTESTQLDETDYNVEKSKSYQLKDIYEKIENTNNNFNGLSRTNDMQKSIKQKTEIEKWSKINNNFDYFSQLIIKTEF